MPCNVHPCSGTSNNLSKNYWKQKLYSFKSATHCNGQISKTYFLDKKPRILLLF